MSILEHVLEAASRAASNAETSTAGAKHLPGAGGRWAKFTEGVPNTVLREALESPGAQFLPTEASSFKVVTDFGQAVSSKGETKIRAVVDFEGNVVNGFPAALDIEFSEPKVDGPLETHWDALIRVVGLFAIVIEGKHWYEEQDFCLIEFAKAILAWLNKIALVPTDFVYSSLESAEPELLRFAHLGQGKWQIRTPHESYREELEFSTESLKRAAEEYLAELGDRLPEGERVLSLLAEKEEYRPLVHLLRRERGHSSSGS